MLDECVPSALARGLRRHLPDVPVLQVGDSDAPPKGTSDAELLAFCEREKRLLITADRATMPDCVKQHLQRGRHSWGVLVVGWDVSLSRILDELSLVYEASEDREWIDVLYYLPFST
jgi:predicted nuclease of predicted toxin-antitoxin system